MQDLICDLKHAVATFDNKKFPGVAKSINCAIKLLRQGGTQKEFQAVASMAGEQWSEALWAARLAASRWSVTCVSRKDAAIQHETEAIEAECAAKAAAAARDAVNTVAKAKYGCWRRRIDI